MLNPIRINEIRVTAQLIAPASEFADDQNLIKYVELLRVSRIGSIWT